MPHSAPPAHYPSEILQLPSHAHNMSVDDVMQALHSHEQGLSDTQISQRLTQFGRNQFPEVPQASFIVLFFRQFRSPMIYILLAAAVISIAVKEFSDAIFIVAVLLLNAVIGSIQEHSAQKSASALNKLVTQFARVKRQTVKEIDAQQLVPGDIVLLQSGDRVPADLRLFSSEGLQINESLLTGESIPVNKDYRAHIAEQAATGDKINMAFSGTWVTRGRAQGVVVATALRTQVGQIAEAVLTKQHAKPPLLIRLEKFTVNITIALAIAVVLMGLVTLMRGMPLVEVLLLAIALAVSAIPEGLPVALTVALSISMRRMAKRNVIARRLVTVEALGSCTYIASDKTGTLTVNELTVRKITLPGGTTIDISGEGMALNGEFSLQGQAVTEESVRRVLQQLTISAVLANEAEINCVDDQCQSRGDAVDVALLVMAKKYGVEQQEALKRFTPIAQIAYESSNGFSASLNQLDGQKCIHVKGALEKILPMCNWMMCGEHDQAIDEARIQQQSEELAHQGYRVLAFAYGKTQSLDGECIRTQHLTGLTLLALVGMIDPLRHETKAAIEDCAKAGLKVAMITGDHPSTALAIAREINLAGSEKDVLIGTTVADAQQRGLAQLDALTRHTPVFARIEPQQKLAIVESLQRNGHFVAVTGDGANDAPALQVAHVGVAMGKNGTDVARETSDMIITDDNFASIVAGIEEGRIAYANVRKVIFLLISTGAGELVLFTLSLFFGMPLPLTAVQLLWLNLVTNGIQDVALAFEPAEGDELHKPPRATNEAIFNRVMIERVVISALVFGIVAFCLFKVLLEQGYTTEQARNHVLLLMVLFENIHVFNCRSESKSIFRMKPLNNPLLLFGTVTAQAVHIVAMYIPGLNSVLGISPVSLIEWMNYLALASVLLISSELHKWAKNYARA